MDVDLSYGSSLLAIISNMKKMKLMKTYLKKLPDKVIDEKVKKQLFEIADSGDDVMFASLFHEQNESQKKMLYSLLKALNSANNVDDLQNAMQKIINKESH